MCIRDSINGGAVAGHGIEIRIFGTEGTIAVSADSALNFQMSELELSGARLPERNLAPLDIPDNLEDVYKRQAGAAAALLGRLY